MAPKVVAIIQARMGSSRLPGKMGMDLYGMPVIDWVLKRTKLARRLHEIVLATSKKGKMTFLKMPAIKMASWCSEVMKKMYYADLLMLEILPKLICCEGLR